jgi:DNA-directed RNA polymerase subunit beta
MQSLALDVNVVSEEGQRTEMRDEDDDLLRAAEELGIDLSGVRAGPSGASDEELEGEDDTDAGPEEEPTAEDGEAGPADDLMDMEAADIDLEGLDREVSAE